MAKDKDESFFEKNMDMWQKWTGSYMDTMFKTMEKTMEQSSAFRQQLDKAVASAVNTQLDGAMTAIKAMERQIEALSSRVEDMLQEQSAEEE